MLQEEGDHLSKLLKKAFPNDNRDTWTYVNLDDAVQNSRRTWETKERIGHGKPQKLFHNLMRKFDAHSNLFQFIPSGNVYASVVTGATAILVKASVNHSKTIESLSDALDAITEAVSIGDVESGLIRSQAMQNAVAKLYIAIFLFLGDAATWYQSSAIKKVAHSLHKNFSERFQASIDKIKDLGANVRYFAQLGSQAEVRVVRLEVEALQDELQDVRVGMSGRFRQLAEYLHAQHGENMKQHEKTQELLTNYQSAGMLPAPPVAERDYQNLIRGSEQLALTNTASSASLSAVNDTENSHAEPVLETGPSVSLTLADHTEFLVQNIINANFDEDALTLNLFDRPLAQALSRWLADPDSSMLYVEYLSSASSEDTMVAAGTALIETYEDNGGAIIPSDLELLVSLRHRYNGAEQGLVVCLIFLAYQIGLLGSRNSRPDGIDWQQPLRPEKVALSNAIRLLRNEIVESPLTVINIVMPGYCFFADIAEEDMESIIEGLKGAMKTGRQIVKILILTHLRIHALVSLLESDEVSLLRQQTGKHKAPKIPIAVLDTDDSPQSPCV